MRHAILTAAKPVLMPKWVTGCRRDLKTAGLGEVESSTGLGET